MMTVTKSNQMKLLNRERIRLKKRKLHDLNKKKTPEPKHHRRLKLLIATSLFCLFSFSQTKNSPERLTYEVNKALTVEFPFAKVYQWYKTNFGETHQVFSLPNEMIDNPLALTVSNIDDLTEGVFVSTEDARIYALEAGVVTYVGVGDNRLDEVRIQHVSGEELVYEHLAKTAVLPYQYVDKNTLLGEVEMHNNHGELYLRLVIQQ